MQAEGLLCNAEQFLNFVELSTQARELSKFEFTKNLSDALELLAEAAERMGLARKEVATLDINDIFSSISVPQTEEIVTGWKKLIQKHSSEKALHEKLVLPPIIFSSNDFEVIRFYLAKPNFITHKNIESKIVHVNDLKDKIVPDLGRLRGGFRKWRSGLRLDIYQKS